MTISIQEPIQAEKIAETFGSPRAQSHLVRFAKPDEFTRAVRTRIDDYFLKNNLSKHDHPRMYVKTIIILSWLALSYCGLVFWATSWPVALLCIVSLGVAMAGVGFNIQHDGGHGAYSKYSWINKIMAFNLDLLGGSSYIWKRTHNIIHHSYTNVTGLDGDIELGFMGRLSPHQPRYSFHRFQHIYLWVLYGFITIKWQFRDDFQTLILGRVGNARVPRPRGWDLVSFFAGKAVFLTLAIGIPLFFFPWYQVILGFLAVSFVQGLLLSIVFQLAHSVEPADFPLPDEDTRKMENSWAAHQVETTVDFARGSRIASWYTGGLNFQIEHHLFPNICHIHYPEMSKIVEQTALEHGVHYNAHPSVWAAIRSHYRWLRLMGQPS